MTPQPHEHLLRRLAIGDEELLEALLGAGPPAAGVAGLDSRSCALVRLAALVALGAPSASYQWCVATALAAGASDEAVAAVLVALVPVVGSVRVGAAAPEVALALGCEPPDPDLQPDGAWARKPVIE